MRILGLESSCDDTAAAVTSSNGEIESSVVWTQLKEHQAFGGVVPEIAARSHVNAMDKVVEAALDKAQCNLADIDLIAVTGGPGLIGGVMVGVMTAKALSLASGIPIIAVNHLAGHALTARLTEQVEYPYLLLLISGGHCQWIKVKSCTEFKLLGATLDDALGEVFDKTAKMLGLGYPGGPAVEALALQGDETRFDLPIPLKGQPNCNFSFSGLKTAVREIILKEPIKTLQDKADLCASFQLAVVKCITNRLKRAMIVYDDAPRLVVAGGVAANKTIKSALDKAASKAGFYLHTPPIALCTDNAAMIAWAGYEQYCVVGATNLDFEARARWPLALKS